MPRIEQIVVAPASTAPMRSLECAQLQAGVGIVSDRYAKRVGTYSVKREPGRQLTLISADGAEAALAAAGRPDVAVADLRRNIVLRGITAEELNAAVGRTSYLGDCELFVHRLCVPCMYNERINNADGLMCGVWDAAGVNAEVVRGGVVRLGDELRIGEADPVRVDDGGKPPAFFKHPKKRTGEEARGLIATREAGRKSAAADPVGTWRMEAAYEKVGITFFAGGMPEGARPPRRIGATASMAALVAVLAVLAWILCRDHGLCSS